jgi:transcriptional regulator with XRE-family HTH domain
MDVATTLRRARARAGLSLRALAARAQTSHSALAAYESGRVSPTIDTLDRILRAAGVVPVLTTVPAPAPDTERAAELIEVLDLAAQFPARHHPTIEFPPFAAGRRA